MTPQGHHSSPEVVRTEWRHAGSQPDRLKGLVLSQHLASHTALPLPELGQSLQELLLLFFAYGP